MDVAKGNTELLHIAYFNRAGHTFHLERSAEMKICIFKISLVVLLIGS